MFFSLIKSLIKKHLRKTKQENQVVFGEETLTHNEEDYDADDENVDERDTYRHTTTTTTTTT